MNYKKILDNIRLNIQQQKKISNLISFVRLFFALIVFLSLYHISQKGYSNEWIIVCLASFFVFLYFINFHQKLTNKIQYNEAITKVCQKEISSEQGLFNQFENGEQQ